jgi:hypothetical protein
MARQTRRQDVELPLGVRELGQGTELHHVARAKYGDLVIAVPISMHRELTRRQMEEHPEEGPDPTHPLERDRRLRFGLADICDCIADLLRWGE